MLTTTDYRRSARAIYEMNDAITGARTEIPLDAEVRTDDDLPGGRWVAAEVWVSDVDALMDAEQAQAHARGELKCLSRT